MRDFSTLPLLDLAPMMHGDHRDQAAFAWRLEQAARDVGFFYLLAHEIPPALFDDLLMVTQRFFALPIEEKMRVYIGKSKNHRGYVPEGEEIFSGGNQDKKEAFDLSLDLAVEDDDDLAATPLLGPNLWPDLPGFREVVRSYYDHTFQIGRVLLRAFSLALKLAPSYLDSFVTRPPSQLRLIHYPFDPEAVDAKGIGAHTDYECFTLLHSTAPGLEVLNGSGQWIEAPPVPGAFIVNIGDMMEVLTNGEFLATSHRVQRVQSERYSFPLFFSFDYHTEVRPLTGFIKPGSEVRPGLIAGEHLYAQTAQTFRYQRERLARGEIKLPESALSLSSFGYGAKQSKGAKR